MGRLKSIHLTNMDHTEVGYQEDFQVEPSSAQSGLGWGSPQVSKKRKNMGPLEKKQVISERLRDIECSPELATRARQYKPWALHYLSGNLKKALTLSEPVCSVPK